MAILRTAPLDERIETIRNDIDAFIAARVAQIQKDCPGVPAGAIRNTLLRGNCQCDAYLQIKAKDAEAERAA